MNRRHFLTGSAATAGLMLARPGRAAVSAADRKFVFVFAQGGWDPTRVFATEFANPNVDMEPQGALRTEGGVTFVDHPARPSVGAFLEQHHARTLVLNGVLVRSIAHEICTMIAMTGDSSGLLPDWPARLATLGAIPTTVPHLVLGGPSFPGPNGAAVARTGGAGQLEALLSGAIRDWTDAPTPALPRATEQLVDDFVLRRAEAASGRVTGGNGKGLVDAYARATRSAADLEDLRYTMDFTVGATLLDQIPVAVEALEIGLSRCVTLSAGTDWDSHDNNDPTQSANFERTFSGLARLLETLRATPGNTPSATLMEETIVVVMSEMGRTPRLNGFAGKDHWTYTSWMLVGDGITGDRVVGAYDDLYYGLGVDPGSADARTDQHMCCPPVVLVMYEATFKKISSFFTQTIWNWWMVSITNPIHDSVYIVTLKPRLLANKRRTASDYKNVQRHA
ncbi:MAG: DUF1501 domain-containing protein [Myxococcota bacterium]